MTYIDIVKGYAQIECVKKGNKYHYYIKDGDDAPFEFQSLKSPTELSKSTEIGHTSFFKSMGKQSFFSKRCGKKCGFGHKKNRSANCEAIYW